MNIDQALAIMVKNKIINSPDYWLKATEVVKYLDVLIINTAKELNNRMVK